MSEYRRDGIVEKRIATMNGIAMVLLLLGLAAFEVFAVAAVRNPFLIVAWPSALPSSRRDSSCCSPTRRR
jgi:hypothetical protein